MESNWYWVATRLEHRAYIHRRLCIHSESAVSGGSPLAERVHRTQEVHLLTCIKCTHQLKNTSYVHTRMYTSVITKCMYCSNAGVRITLERCGWRQIIAALTPTSIDANRTGATRECQVPCRTNAYSPVENPSMAYHYVLEIHKDHFDKIK